MGSTCGYRTALLFAVLLSCSLGLGAGSVAGGYTAGGPQSPPANTHSPSDTGFGNINSESFDAERTLFSISVRENGSAEWQFRYEQRLESDSGTEDFETYADRFNTEKTESFRNFRDRATELAGAGSEAVDRNMTAETFRRDARIEERGPAGEAFAIVEMSFVWTGFAETDGERVVVGDVFVGGLYIGPDQRLRIERGPNLQFESAAPEPDSTAAETLTESETVTWIGEMQFADRQPRVVFVQRVEAPSTGTETPPSNGIAGPTALFVAVTIVFLLGAGGAFAYRSGLFDTARTGDEGRSNDAIRSDEPEPPDATGDDPDGAAPGGDTIVEAERSDGSDASVAIPDEEVLSDEERIVSLLESEGGRMKQVDIVERTDWSKSKVSMQLSEMEDEGTISKLRVGRENIISLAGHEPDAVGSPFDDE
jgi:uncharacterized membrane protein